jgi:uncharacterized membrane protein
MRSFRERLLHSLLFELVLLGICTPILSFILDKSATHTGMMSVGLSVTAMICNGIYNYIFDRALIFLKRSLYPRSFGLRCFHSLLFEISLLFMTVPLVMWWMDIPFYQALLLDLSFALFVPVYALMFNWLFDIAFPVSKYNSMSKIKESSI